MHLTQAKALEKAMKKLYRRYRGEDLPTTSGGGGGGGGGRTVSPSGAKAGVGDDGMRLKDKEIKEFEAFRRAMHDGQSDYFL